MKTAMVDFVLKLNRGDRFMYRESATNLGVCEMVENRSTQEQIDVSIKILVWNRTVDIVCGPSGAYLGATFSAMDTSCA
jgi:hypothetical protein